jgi:hypothetical protein
MKYHCEFLYIVDTFPFSQKCPLLQCHVDRVHLAAFSCMLWGSHSRHGGAGRRGVAKSFTYIELRGLACANQSAARILMLIINGMVQQILKLCNKAEP